MGTKNETYLQEENEKEIIPVIIAGLDYGNRPSFDHSMEEMEALAVACDMEAVCIVVQNLNHPDPGTYMGSGKVMEIQELVQELEAEYVIFEDNLN